MPNPVVHFEIRGPDAESLRAFYRDAFGWGFEPLGGDFALVETEAHTHEQETGRTTYLGADAHMNEGVVLEERGGDPTWRYAAEERVRYFAPGIGGAVAGPLEGYPSGISISIEVPDLDAALERIESLGGRCLERPREPVPGVWVAAFADPAGNRVGLVRAP